MGEKVEVTINEAIASASAEITRETAAAEMLRARADEIAGHEHFTSNRDATLMIFAAQTIEDMTRRLNAK